MTTLQLSGASTRIDALFREHRDVVYRSLLRDLGSPADADDATQTVFLSAFRSLERGCRPQAPRAWLLAIANNAARRTWRQRQRSPTELDPDALAGPDRPDEARQTLVEALAELPERQRKALLLRELCGLHYDEISQLTEQTVAGVETTVFRARRAVRAALLDDGALTHDAAAKLLKRFVAGKLTRQERESLQAHLANCEECTAAEAELRAPKLRRRLLSWLLSVPTALQRLVGLLESGPGPGLAAVGVSAVTLAGIATAQLPTHHQGAAQPVGHATAIPDPNHQNASATAATTYLARRAPRATRPTTAGPQEAHQLARR